MTICYPDSTDWSCALTEEQIDELDPVVRARAEALAWSSLQALTGGNIAICPNIVRPCAARCGGGTWYTAPVTGASQSPWPAGNGSFQPTINGNGQWVNTCGCSTPDSCSCTTVREVILPGIVGDIVRVTLNGADLDPTAYRVDNGNRLVRQDGETWPLCQDMNLPADDDGAFVVEYYDGAAPDTSLNYAAGLLAVEFYRACTNQSCALPGGVVSVVKQGITMTVAQGLFTNGFTGIKPVDAVISIYNPFGHKRRPVIIAPGIPAGRTQTWGRY